MSSELADFLRSAVACLGSEFLEQFKDLLNDSEVTDAIKMDVICARITAEYGDTGGSQPALAQDAQAGLVTRPRTSPLTSAGGLHVGVQDPSRPAVQPNPLYTAPMVHEAQSWQLRHPQVPQPAAAFVPQAGEQNLPSSAQFNAAHQAGIQVAHAGMQHMLAPFSAPHPTLGHMQAGPQQGHAPTSLAHMFGLPQFQHQLPPRPVSPFVQLDVAQDAANAHNGPATPTGAYNAQAAGPAPGFPHFSPSQMPPFASPFAAPMFVQAPSPVVLSMSNSDCPAPTFAGAPGENPLQFWRAWQQWAAAVNLPQTAHLYRLKHSLKGAAKNNTEYQEFLSVDELVNKLMEFRSDADKIKEANCINDPNELQMRLGETVRDFKQRFISITGRANKAAKELSWAACEGPALANLFERMLLPNIRSQVKLMSPGLLQPTLEQLATFAARAEEAANINLSSGTLTAAATAEPAWKKQRLELMTLKEEVHNLMQRQQAAAAQLSVGGMAAAAEATSHGEQKARGPCYNFRNRGTCRFGDRCQFEHETQPQRAAMALPQGYNRNGNQRDQDRRICKSCGREGHQAYGCCHVCRGCGAAHDPQGCSVILRRALCNDCGKPGHTATMCRGTRSQGFNQRPAERSFGRREVQQAPARRGPFVNPERAVTVAMAAAEATNQNIERDLRSLQERLSTLTQEPAEAKNCH